MSLHLPPGQPTEIKFEGNPCKFDAVAPTGDLIYRGRRKEVVFYVIRKLARPWR